MPIGSAEAHPSVSPETASECGADVGKDFAQPGRDTWHERGNRVLQPREKLTKEQLKFSDSPGGMIV